MAVEAIAAAIAAREARPLNVGKLFVASDEPSPRSGRSLESPYRDYSVSPSYPEDTYPRNRQRFERNYGTKMQSGEYQGGIFDADRENRSEMVKGNGIEYRGERQLFESEEEDLLR